MVWEGDSALCRQCRKERPAELGTRAWHLPLSWNCGKWATANPRCGVPGRSVLEALHPPVWCRTGTATQDT